MQVMNTMQYKINYRVDDVIKQLVHASAVRMLRYEPLGKFGELTRGLRSYACFVLTKLPASVTSRTLTNKSVVSSSTVEMAAWKNSRDTASFIPKSLLN